MKALIKKVLLSVLRRRKDLLRHFRSYNLKEGKGTNYEPESPLGLLAIFSCQAQHVEGSFR